MYNYTLYVICNEKSSPIYRPQWKVVQIIMIPKVNKDPIDVKLYRPISLFPIISKLFQKLLFQKLMFVIAKKRLIPNYQFGFRNKHATIEQIHRITLQRKLLQPLKQGNYSAVFLNMS